MGAAGNGDESDATTVFGAGDEDDEPFLRLLRRVDKSDSGVWAFATGSDNGCGLEGSASEGRRWNQKGVEYLEESNCMVDFFSAFRRSRRC